MGIDKLGENHDNDAAKATNMSINDMDAYVEDKKKEGKSEFDAYKDLMKTLQKNGFLS